ncbi:uracil-DNA glycosylase family protein [Kordiimonas pumila]|uniref:Uracil-DNA glycosylase family protein n=1 Tax=Kordiimonas pumila TaxID=2161677 RepID=A0ABV7D7D5_9PROT|nr:uracil-DNA glycosylase family protein [Kordiimonas pumila]
MQKFAALSHEIQACTLCSEHLPHTPRPVFQSSPASKILIAGQAPGRKVHETGIPFDDASGERLRSWMGIGLDDFYNPEKVAILPMGFCFPGTGKSGDLPPRQECAPKWRQKMLNNMPDIGLTLVIGQYALAWHLGERSKASLTETVRNWRCYGSKNIMPLPHPSPRNNIWLAKNPWFTDEVLPVLKQKVSHSLA